MTARQGKDYGPVQLSVTWNQAGRCTPPAGLRIGGAVSGRSSLLARWPVLDRHPHARSWLEAWSDLGRARRTIDAYARGLAEYLEVCELRGVDRVLAGRA